ncbi:MAG: bifunctional diguanylate cyclase/phosphodiesterase [Campylobacterota bacterium]|nr:bifunctional diguanylate cyclase/phosphodiesterase [Campylobacterota bacterium]
MSFADDDKLVSYDVDYLTGLENRFGLMDYLKVETSRTNIFLLNLDNFSSLNKAYGFNMGDKILIEAARLLKLLKPQNARLFRFDGDEFVFVITDFMNFRQLQEFAASIISFFNQSVVEIEKIDLELKLSFSVGIAMGNGLSALKHAKMAISDVRAHAKGSYKIYSERSDHLAHEEEVLFWVNKIKHALENESLTPFFQPIVDNKTGETVKFECLARIQEGNAIISPGIFMEASKITGTLSLVTKIIIKESFKKFADNDFTFSINITESDLHLGYLENYLLENSEKYGIDPSRVALEILEDITTLDESDILAQIASVRKRGFKVSVDDFGAESSNLSRLLEFNPDFLKIDGSFIKDILTDNQSQIIVEAIIDICHKSDIKVIAEYVHSQAVLDKVVEMGVDYSQGYFLGAPQGELP